MCQHRGVLSVRHVSCKGRLTDDALGVDEDVQVLLQSDDAEHVVVCETGRTTVSDADRDLCVQL